MKIKVVLILSVLISLGLFSSCSSSDENVFVIGDELSEADDDEGSDPNSIIGEWEFDTVRYPFYIEKKVPTESRDLYHFYTNGKIKVVRKYHDALLYLNEGVYDYSYDSSKQEIFVNGQLRSCTISDGVMTISGDFSAYKESITGFVFTKKQ